MKVIIMINIISNITCTLLKYRVVSMITGNVFPHQIFPSPPSNDSKSFVGGWELYLTNTQRAQLLRPSTAPCGRLLKALLLRYVQYTTCLHLLLLVFSLSEQNTTSKYSSLSTIKYCKAKTVFRLWSDSYSLNIFMVRCMGHTNKKKKSKLIIWCNVPMNIYIVD